MCSPLVGCCPARGELFCLTLSKTSFPGGYSKILAGDCHYQRLGGNGEKKSHGNKHYHDSFIFDCFAGYLA